MLSPCGIVAGHGCEHGQLIGGLHEVNQVQGQRLMLRDVACAHALPLYSHSLRNLFNVTIVSCEVMANIDTLNPFKRLSKLLNGIEPSSYFGKGPLELHVGSPAKGIFWMVGETLLSTDGYDVYSPVAESALIAGIQQYMQQRNGVDLAPNQIGVVRGTKSALYLLARIFGNRHDGRSIAIPDLGYATYFTANEFAGIPSVFVPAHNQADSASCKDLSIRILNSPHNPLGIVLQKKDLEHIATHAVSHNYIAVNDECYIDIHYGWRPESLLSVDPTKTYKNLLVVNSLSKSASLPGLRSGFIAGDANLIAQFMAEYGELGIGMSAREKRASEIAWSQSSFMDARRMHYCCALQHFADIYTDIQIPQAGFYFFLPTKRSGEDVTRSLWRRGIKVLPGAYMDASRSNTYTHTIRVSVNEKLPIAVIQAIQLEAHA